jgi:hypothetical protein
VIRLRKTKDIFEIIEYTKLFNEAIGYSNIPWKYFASGDCYILRDKEKILGGFVLVPGYFNLRSVLQMGDEKFKDFYSNYPNVSNNLCDFTGYYIKNSKYGAILTLYLILVCLFYKKKYFVYSYAVEEKGLGKYYSSGNPIRIHTGVPEKLEGHKESMPSEHVEILTRSGIFRIFWYRTKKLLFRSFR